MISTGQLLSQASKLAAEWGDPQAGIEHATVAVLQRAAGAGTLDAAGSLRVAAAIAAAREGVAGAAQFAARGSARRPAISTDLRTSLAAFAERAPAVPDEWLEWVEEALSTSPRAVLRALAADVSTLVATTRRRPASSDWVTNVPFTIDLTELASKGQLSPVFGRAAELDVLVRVLGRRIKNNPVLIGPPGVGKTAIVELLASRIVEGTVPRQLSRARILQLNVGEVVAGTRYRGDLEERVGALVRALDDQQRLVILFVDEIHLLVGAGLSEGSPIDLGNLLKPALGRGAIHLIGATTDAEYEDHIRRDAALERRLHPITIREPGLKETSKILDRLRPVLELHHDVYIPAKVVRRAVLMSTALMSDRFQPDKAIDLLDEAASHRRRRSDRDERVTVSIDDLLAVGGQWRTDRAGSHAAVRPLPRTAGDALAGAVVFALTETSLVAESAPEVITVTGAVSAEDLAGELEERLGDIIALNVVPPASWPRSSGRYQPEAASVVLVADVAGGLDGQALSALVAGHLAEADTTPRVVVLFGAAGTVTGVDPTLALEFPEAADDPTQRRLERLVQILGAGTGRIRLDATALGVLADRISLLEPWDRGAALNDLQRSISGAVARELAILPDGYDIVINVGPWVDGVPLVIADQVKRSRWQRRT